VLFLYRAVLHIEIGLIEHVPRARMPVRAPVVLRREEVARTMKHLDGVTWMIVALLYGAGLRLHECLELRVKDIDRERRQIVIRRGKGQKDRPTVLPAAVVEPLSRHLEGVQHEADLARGFGRVVLPAAKHVHRRCRVFDAKIRAHRDMRLAFIPHTIADGREEIERSTPREVRPLNDGPAKIQTEHGRPHRETLEHRESVDRNCLGLG